MQGFHLKSFHFPLIFLFSKGSKDFKWNQITFSWFFLFNLQDKSGFHLKSIYLPWICLEFYRLRKNHTIFSWFSFYVRQTSKSFNSSRCTFSWFSFVSNRQVRISIQIRLLSIYFPFRSKRQVRISTEISSLSIFSLLIWKDR